MISDRREIIELFLIDTIPSLYSQRECPRINFVFNEDGIKLINYVKEHPFIKKDSWTPNIEESDIERLNDIDKNYLTININDAELFFDLLTQIVNEQCKLESEYDRKVSVRNRAMFVLKRIWLRMGEIDSNNIEMFLKKQLDFLKNREFDYDTYSLNEYDDNLKYYYYVLPNYTYCESTRKINYSIMNDKKEIHNLPSIYYDIKDGICYIYAVQNYEDRKVVKSIERKLYRINDGKDALVHPNFTTALRLFLDLLSSHDINEIKVPLNQVLSYDFHVILSNEAKKNFSKKWKDISNLNQYRKEEYNHDKLWYSHVVDKEDVIEKNKIEGLYNLFKLLEELGYVNIDGINIDNELNISINIKQKTR